jgi:hypothetical protein
MELVVAPPAFEPPVAPEPPAPLGPEALPLLACSGSTSPSQATRSSATMDSDRIEEASIDAA